jgi:hypothetical protein
MMMKLVNIATNIVEYKYMLNLYSMLVVTSFDHRTDYKDNCSRQPDL